jgi:hypothetical protein
LDFGFWILGTEIPLSIPNRQSTIQNRNDSTHQPIKHYGKLAAVDILSFRPKGEILL